MRLSIQDRNELMKAVVRAETLPTLKRYVMSLVDAIDDLPDGKSDAQVPRYTEPAANGDASSIVTPNGGRLWEDVRPAP